MLGTASAMPVSGRNQSAQALQVCGRLFLIDCGEGTQYRMHAEHVPMMKLDSIFLSHIHGDHVFGIFGLLSTLGMKGRQTPLNIFAPLSFGPILKFFLSYYGEGVAYEIRFTPLKMKEPETLLETKSLRVEAFPLNHGIETFGFRFREKDPLHNVYKEAIARYGLTLTEIGTLKRGEDVVRADGSVIPAAEAAYKPFVPRSYAYVSDTALSRRPPAGCRAPRFSITRPPICRNTPTRAPGGTIPPPCRPRSWRWTPAWGSSSSATILPATRMCRPTRKNAARSFPKPSPLLTGKPTIFDYFFLS